MRPILVLLLTLFVACAGSESTTKGPESTPQRVDPVTEEPEEFDVRLESETETPEESGYAFLSALSDTYFNRSNEIPEAYERIKEEIVEEEKDLYEGYRVQIFSGQNVALADTAARHFRAWSAEYIDGYQAETYTFFKAPYYRVHVGDFHDRTLAIEFSNLVKRRFRDSWVVYDRVNPFNVPSDTTVIIIKR
jgi:hypothetical protein